MPDPGWNIAGSVVTQYPMMNHTIDVKPPYRLDLTVSALRRAPTNVVDVYTPDGRYLRALGTHAQRFRGWRRSLDECAASGRLDTPSCSKPAPTPFCFNKSVWMRPAR